VRGEHASINPQEFKVHWFVRFILAVSTWMEQYNDKLHGKAALQYLEIGPAEQDCIVRASGECNPGN
jgi:hypothetical protein